MTDRYVDSNATGLADGTSWADAYLTVAAAATASVAGDRIFVASNHAETGVATNTILTVGTTALPSQIIAVAVATPPTAVADTAAVSTTSTGPIAINGSLYCYGVIFSCGGGTGGPVMSVSGVTDTVQTYENCRFRLTASGTAAELRIGGTTSGFKTAVTWRECYVRFASAGQCLQVRGVRFVWEGGQWEAGGVSPTTMIESSAIAANSISISGVELSSVGAATNLFTVVNGTLRAVVRDCKLPPSWTGQLATNLSVGSRVEMYNCDGADTNYRLWVEDFLGSITSETTVVRTGGASDGTTPLAWKMTSNANVSYPGQPLPSPEIAVWNETTGSAKTVTVEVVTDNVTLTDAECWLELLYLGSVSSPWGTWAADVKSTVLATAADQTASSEAWTTTGLTTPIKQKLSVTFTPREKGFLLARVLLAKPSTTVYVCPWLTVS